MVQIDDILWRGLPAWRLNDQGMVAVVTKCGANIAALMHESSDVNPLWQPVWEASLPDAPGVTDGRYGAPVESPLLANIVGWNLCIDRFGAPHPGEERPLHGEAGISVWKLIEIDGGVRLETNLPLAGLVVSRQLRLTNDGLEVETVLRNPTPDAKVVEWAEHITLGDPLLDGCDVSAGVDTAFIGPEDLGPSPRFPGSAPLEPVDAATALAVPKANDPALGDILSARVTEGWWQVRNESLGWECRCEFDADDFPWLCLWTEHCSRDGAPWGGKVRSRGMEISTKPFPEGQPPADRSPTFAGRPTAVSLESQGVLTKKVTLILRKI